MSGVEKVVPKKTLISLVKQAGEVKKRTQSIAGEFGEQVADAVETKHLHKGAFGLVAKLDRMDELKRKEFERNLSLYIDMMYESGRWAGHEGDLAETVHTQDEDEQPAADPAAQEAAHVENNVRTLRRGIKQKVEDEQPAGMPGAENVH